MKKCLCIFLILFLILHDRYAKHVAPPSLYIPLIFCRHFSLNFLLSCVFYQNYTTKSRILQEP